LPFAKREGRRLFLSNKWVFQQDGAKPHTSNIAQKYCNNNLHKFINKNQWPPNSPDLNPLDYFYWNAVVRNISINKYAKYDEFKAEISKACEKVDQNHIKKSVQSFTNRVRKVEEAQGNYTIKK